MSDFSPTRLVGLDIVRGGAILAVLFAHGRYLMDAPDDYLFLTITGKFGVELFFVLSGFLIGAILIRACERELSSGSLLRFWTRRWLRTLPAYFAVLLFVWAVFGEVDIRYFFFLQDLLIGNWNILPVSWTLVIEEWFYLLFPPACFILWRFSPRWGFVTAATMLLLTSVVLMYQDYGSCAAATNPLRCFEIEIRKFTFRFTSLGMGAMLAWLHHRRDIRIWLRPHLVWLQLATWSIVAVVLLICADIILRHPGVLPVPLAFALFYPLMGVGSVMIVALMYVWEPSPPKIIGTFFTFMSVTSYSCYLWHLMINDYIGEAFPEWNQYLAVLVFLVASLLVGWLSYYAVEKPFLLLRDKLTR